MATRFPPDSPLHAFADAEVQAIFAASTAREVGANEAIVTVGTPGESMFFVLEGRAEARLHTGETLRTYGPGSYFGELSFINPGHKRSATITAVTSMRLQELDQRSVQALIAEHPNAIFTLLRRTCAFLVDAERTLVADLRRQNAQLSELVKNLQLTQQRLSEEELTARTDGLTGLWNRRCFDAELTQYMARAEATRTLLAVIAMDLDHFKPVNDTIGHAAGDFVLREVGKILKGQIRKTDLPCRIGGDEFIVLLADLSESAARKRAESLRAAIGSFEHPGNERGIRITTTMGGTLYRPGEAAEELLHRADEALYAAKRAGRNRVRWAEDAG